MFGGPMSRMTQIKKSSDMAMLFDGLRSHNYNTYNISPRHGGKRYANFMFADGHADHVNVPDLWTLHWSEDFNPRTVVMPR